MLTAPSISRVARPARRRLPERKQLVTIAVGFLCADGIVLGTDTLFSGINKRFSAKIWPIHLGDTYVAFAAAGVAMSIGRIFQELKARLQPPMSVDEIMNTIDGVLSDLAKKLSALPDNDLPSLLVAIRAPGRYALMENDGNVVLSHVMKPSQCIGSGASLGLYFADSLFRGEMSVKWARIIGAHLLKQAKEHVDGCGGDTSGLYRSFLELCDAPTGIDICPPNRLCAFVVLGDKPAQLAREVGHGREDAARQKIAFHLGEPELHLVEPRSGGGRVMQLHVRMRLEERQHRRRFMSRQVVRNDVDLAVAPLRRHDLLQEPDELVTGVARGRFADDRARLRFQGGIEGEGPVTDVLEAVALGAAGRQRQDRIASVEGLNRGLFIDAEDGCVLRRIQIQPDNLRRFRFEIGIGRSQVALQSMRLQAGPFPCALNNRVRHAQPIAEPPRRPMGGAVRRRLAGPAQDPRFHLRRQHASFRSTMAAAQSGNAVRFIPGFPSRDGLRRAVDALADRRVRVSVGEQQNDPGPSGFVGTPAVRTRKRLELGSGATRQRQRSGSRHAAYYHSSND
jgi:20S proteasome alpha/beta subunit